MILKTQNDKNLAWLDCIYAKKFDNDFILNIHIFRNNETQKNLYSLRLGYLGQENKTPVLTLFEAEEYKKVFDYCRNFENNLKDIYIFN